MGRAELNARRKAEMEAQAEKDRKLLTCRNCGDEFAVERSPGRYPDFCSKDECQAASRKHWSSLGPQERAERNAERRRQYKRAQRAHARQVDREMREERLRRERESKVNGRTPKPKPARKPPPKPPVDEPEFRPTPHEIKMLTQMVERYQGVTRSDLRAAVRQLAFAEGIDATYAHLLDVAAIATAWACRIRPGMDGRPDFDGISDKIEAAERDYPELMAA